MATKPFNPEYIRGSVDEKVQQLLDRVAIEAQAEKQREDETIRRLLPRTKPGMPVTLTGLVTLTPGTTLPVNIEAMRNPSKMPLAIHEIKFVSATVVSGAISPVTAVAVGSSGGTVPPSSAGVLEASIQLEDWIITKTPTPLNLLGVRRSAVTEVLAKPDGTNVFGLANMTWRLDAPLVLRGGQALNVAIGHRGFYPYDVSVYISLSGRFLPTMPKAMHVPYVAPYVPTAFTPSTAAGTRTSSERDLANELKLPLKVKRFVGRISTIANGMTRIWDTVPMVNSNLCTVSMRSITGVPSVRNDTPFEMVFDAHSAAWECPHLLPPGAYWIATVKCAQTTTTVAQVQAGIALHGTREEIVP